MGLFSQDQVEFEKKICSIVEGQAEMIFARFTAGF
jgi:hypothetical protein